MAGLSPMHENSPRALHLNPFCPKEQLRDENGDQRLYLFLVDDRLDCNVNNCRRATLVRRDERQVSSQTPNLRNHRLRRNWLRPNDLIAFSSPGPRGNFMVTFGIKECCTLYKCLLLICSFSADNTRPRNKIRSFSLKLKT